MIRAFDRRPLGINNSLRAARAATDSAPNAELKPQALFKICEKLHEKDSFLRNLFEYCALFGQKRARFLTKLSSFLAKLRSFRDILSIFRAKRARFPEKLRNFKAFSRTFLQKLYGDRPVVSHASSARVANSTRSMSVTDSDQKALYCKAWKPEVSA